MASGMGDGSYGAVGGEQGPEQYRNKEQGNEGKGHMEIHTGKPHRVQIKVAIPIKEHPNFNFVGKLLGPKGASLKQLQEMTQTRMAILGRGSMRDKKKEEELRTNGEPKYAHLNDDLHVEVSAYAPPSEAYRRIAFAIEELSRIFVPDYNDGSAGPYPPHDMSVNGRGGQKPGFGFEDPSMGAARPPPGPVPPPVRGGAGYWSPARGAASRRVLQPRPGPAASAPRRAPPPSSAADYSYDDSYGRYDSGGASSEYYQEPGMEGGESGFGGDDYSAEQSRSGPTRGYARARPYSASTRPY